MDAFEPIIKKIETVQKDIQRITYMLMNVDHYDKNIKTIQESFEGEERDLILAAYNQAVNEDKETVQYSPCTAEDFQSYFKVLRLFH